MYVYVCMYVCMYIYIYICIVKIKHTVMKSCCGSSTSSILAHRASAGVLEPLANAAYMYYKCIIYVLYIWSHWRMLLIKYKILCF